MNSSFLQRLCASLLKPVDISFLVFFRIVFGGIMLWETYRFFANDWISRHYIEPAIYFTYYGFSWVKPWPGRGMYIHFFALGVFAVCIIAGFFYRAAAVLFFLGFAYVFLLDQTRYLNHFYLITLISFLLIFVPAERAFSLDAVMRPQIRADFIPAWTLWLLRLQVGIAYFYGGIAKLNYDWLHGEPMRIWLSPITRSPGIGHYFAQDWMVYTFAYGGLLLDLLVVPLLLWRRTRIFAFIAAVIFNIFNALLFNIGIFPWFMLGATLIFFPPDLVRRIVRAFSPDPEEGEEKETPGGADNEQLLPMKGPASYSELSGKQRIVAASLVVYVMIQLLLPLRHILYPGNVNWTEEGHNFSWHMKLRTKRADATFTITDPRTGQTWSVDPRKYLEPRQLMKMATHPDMVLQFAHHLAEEKRREGYQNVEVRARVTASLNGRRPQLMIDPNADLAKEPLSLRRAHWILPLAVPLEDRGSIANEADDPDQ